METPQASDRKAQVECVTTRAAVNPADGIAFEAAFSAHCRAAKLSAVQTEIVELWLVERMTVREIRRKLHASRVSEIQAELAKALKLLASHTPGFWDPAHDFPRHLMGAVSNRANHDDRPQDMRGVSPAPETKRFQGAPIISADDQRLRQDIPSAARLWANSLQPVTAA